MGDKGKTRCWGGGRETKLEVVNGKRVYIYKTCKNRHQVYTTSRPDSSPLSTQPTKTAKVCGLSDSETKRRKRIAKYKSYGVEGRIKSSIRSGIRWIKMKCSNMIHG